MIKRLWTLIVRKIHGHTNDCCDRIRDNCKKCPFNPENVKRIMEIRRQKDHKGFH